MVPKTASFIDAYLSGSVKKPKPKKEDKEPKLYGHKALVAKYMQGEKLKGVKSSGIPGQPKAE